MAKGGGSVRANLRATRAQMNNASTSAQTRAFKARQIAKQRRDAEERKLRAMQAAKRKAEAEAAPAPSTEGEGEGDGDGGESTPEK